MDEIDEKVKVTVELDRDDANAFLNWWMKKYGFNLGGGEGRAGARIAYAIYQAEA